MKRLRKALALLLCLAVCLTLMPAAFAEEPTEDYLTWEDAPVANETRPIITGQPASISVTEGETATFTVKATGTNLKYQWQFMAAGTTFWQNAASTSATLSFTATTDQNSYAYHCIISNGGGSVTSELALLSVSAGSGTVTKPSITTQPKSVTAADGTQTTFSVRASGSGLKYQWQYRTSSSGSWTNSSAASGTTRDFVVNARTAIDGYQYRCKVSNSAGAVYTSVVTLTVSSSTVSKPVVTKHPANFSAPNGTQTTISVTATGSGLKYQWQYRTSSSGSWTNSSAASANSRVFTVNARTAINGYQYRCKVSNSAGYVYSKAATLTVTNSSKPSITTQPKSVTAADGTQTTFSVRASGSGLKYQWQYRTSSSGSWTNSSAASGTTRDFVVNARTTINGYQYRCKVSNSAGTVYSSIVKLTVVTKPTITTQPKSVTAADGTQTTFSVTAKGGSLKYQWQYRTSSSGSWTNSTAASGTTKDFVVNARTAINGYQYRCKVSNSAGTVYTNIVKLTVVTKPTITTQPKSVTADDGTTATFSVTASGTSLKYQWQYRTSSSGSWTNSTSASGTTKTLTVNARTAINGYQYRCRVSNSAGYVYTNVVTLTVKVKNPVTYRALLIGEEQFWRMNQNTGAIYTDPAPRNRVDVNNMASMLAAVSGPEGGKYTVTKKFDRTREQILSDISSTFAGADSNDVSLFFIATHGVTTHFADQGYPEYEGALEIYTGGYQQYVDYSTITLEDLAAALDAIPGKKIVLLESCGSGTGVYQSGVAENAVGEENSFDPDAFDELVSRAFAAVDDGIAANRQDEANIGDFVSSEFYVLTASRHRENSYGNDSIGNYFTIYLVEGARGAAENNGDGYINMHELFLYIKANATGPYTFYYDDGTSENFYQHVQEYPKNSSYKLFDY